MKRPRRNIYNTDVHEVSLRSVRPWLIWAISFGVWTLIAVVGSGTISQWYRSMGGKTAYWATLASELCQILPYVPLTPLVFSLATRYSVNRRNWMRRSALYLFAGILFGALLAGMRGLTPYAGYDSKLKTWHSAIWDPQSHTWNIQWHMFGISFLRNVVDDFTGAFIPIVFIAHVVSFYRRNVEREQRASRLESQLAKANLRALKSQLQPHFLFNTMHSISALMLTDVRAADKMMTRLSDLLRMSLEHDGDQVTTLNRELEFANGYLQIEKIRFGNRLEVLSDVAPDTLDARVPHLLMQPLIENAIRHGIGRLTAGGRICIISRRNDSNLHLTISDNGPGFNNVSLTHSTSGLGLRATQERLQTLYGVDQKFEILSPENGGAEISIRIPFHQLSEPQRE